MRNIAEHGNRRLVIVLSFITIGAIGGVLLFWSRASASMRAAFLPEVAKALLQILTVAVIGGIVKLIIDDHQARRRESTEAELRNQQREERLQAFKVDKVRRLVGITSTLRQVPILLEAHRSAKTYNEQMREVVNAGIELRLLRHETDAAGPVTNAAFPNWSEIRDAIRKMETYIAWIVSDFRSPATKELSELQRRAEADRSLQGSVWEKITAIPSVHDLLQDPDIDATQAARMSRFRSDYLAAYESALKGMLSSTLNAGGA